MNQPLLPAVPTPAPPVDPPCAWCGSRPAIRYEVAAPTWGTRRQADADGVVHSTRTMTKQAIVAYACRRHEELFDGQKAEIAARKAHERQPKK